MANPTTLTFDNLSADVTQYKGSSEFSIYPAWFLSQFNGSTNHNLGIAIKPETTLSEITFVLSATILDLYDLPTYFYYTGTEGAHPGVAAINREGTELVWSSKQATFTLTGTFEADKTYYVWLAGRSGRLDQAVSFTKDSSGISLSAKIKTYPVRYDANGGSGAPGMQTKYHGIPLALSSIQPAKASVVTPGATVSFNGNGGQINKLSETSEDVTRYEFSAWNTAQSGGGTIYRSGEIYEANEEVTLYAQYNGTVSKGSIPLPNVEDCVRQGYTLLGFSDLQGDTEPKYAPGAPYLPQKSITLYAVWKALGLVFIWTGSGFKAYQCFIYHDGVFRLYAPYVYKGTGFVLCG